MSFSTNLLLVYIKVDTFENIWFIFNCMYMGVKICPSVSAGAHQIQKILYSFNLVNTSLRESASLLQYCELNPGCL